MLEERKVSLFKVKKETEEAVETVSGGVVFWSCRGPSKYAEYRRVNTLEKADGSMI